LVDTTFTRLGSAAGSSLIAVLSILWIQQLYTALIVATVLCCGLATLLARRMGRLYVGTLERSLVNHEDRLNADDAPDMLTRTVLRMRRSEDSPPRPFAGAVQPTESEGNLIDRDAETIRLLHSRDRDAIRGVLSEELADTLVPHVIPLLEWDEVAANAGRALGRVAENHVGQLVDALVDPNRPFAVRRQLARVLSACRSQRAVDGLLIAMDDFRFAVRVECARSLSRILDQNSHLHVDRGRILEVTLRELMVAQPILESQRALASGNGDPPSAVDAVINDRSSESLAHVFRLLALVLPAKPIRVAYAALRTDDSSLRSVAVEYLENVVPGQVFERLLRFIDEEPRVRIEKRSREAILQDLLGSNNSIVLNLEALTERVSQQRDD